MLELGADGPAFDTIVASGAELRDPAPRADRPAARARRPAQDRLRRASSGYHADMTRTVVVGEPADWQREIYDLCARRSGPAATRWRRARRRRRRRASPRR